MRTFNKKRCATLHLRVFCVEKKRQNLIFFNTERTEEQGFTEDETLKAEKNYKRLPSFGNTTTGCQFLASDISTKP